MAQRRIDKLPEELLLAIFKYLDTAAPSDLQSRLEPSLSLTHAKTATYKDISFVCRRWRRILLPLLFRNSRLRLDIQARSEWRGRNVYGPESSFHNERGLHEKKAIDETAHTLETNIQLSTHAGRSLGEASLEWANRFHHALEDYLSFITLNNLQSSIQSFVLLTDRMLPEFDNRYPHRLAATQDYRYRAAATIWHHLYSTISPITIKVLAPPPELAILTNCAIDLFGEWAFSDMDFHIVTLSVDNQKALRPLPHLTDEESLQYIPPQYPSIAPSSILRLQPWSHLGLNEGSFLKAYGTYEYFERGPPSLIYSIKPAINPKISTQLHQGIAPGTIDLAALKSFAYTAILPFATHLDFRSLIPHLEILDVQLAPHPSEQQDILGDKERVGHAVLEDTWQEFFTAYRFITRPFRTFDIDQNDGTPKLKKFICRDKAIQGLKQELDDEFMPLCLPCWAEMEDGVFVRQCEVPPRLYDWDMG